MVFSIVLSIQNIKNWLNEKTINQSVNNRAYDLQFQDHLDSINFNLKHFETNTFVINPLIAINLLMDSYFLIYK